MIALRQIAPYAASSRPTNDIFLLLRQEGCLVSHKLVYRLYCEEGLAMRAERLGVTGVARHERIGNWRAS